MAQNTIWRVQYSAQQLADTASNQVPRISSTTSNWECWDIATSAWMDTGVPAAGKNPYIGNDNYWYVWDSVQNQYVKTSYSVAQDAVQSVNGVFADAGGNVSLAWADMNGANPISKGGTGKTTAQSGLRALISGCSALTDSDVASGDFIPLQDASDSTNAKKITLDNFGSYLAANIPYMSKIQSGSYIGTGTVGVGNPNSITCAFAPKIIFCGDTQLSLSNYTNDAALYLGCMLTSQLTTSYQMRFGFGKHLDSSGVRYYLYAKLSSDGKTVYWYSDAPGRSYDYLQNNKSDTTYYWLAIG